MLLSGWTHRILLGINRSPTSSLRLSLNRLLGRELVFVCHFVFSQGSKLIGGLDVQRIVTIVLYFFLPQRLALLELRVSIPLRKSIFLQGWLPSVAVRVSFLLIVLFRHGSAPFEADRTVLVVFFHLHRERVMTFFGFFRLGISSQLLLQLSYFLFGSIKFGLIVVVVLLMVVLDGRSLLPLHFGLNCFFLLVGGRRLLLAFFGFELQHLLVVVRLFASVDLGQRLHPLPFIFHLLDMSELQAQFFFSFFAFPFLEVLLGLHSVFDGLADERIGACAFDVIDIEIAEVGFLGGGGVEGLRVDDAFLGDGGIVAQSLEVLFVGGFEVLLSLGDFDHVRGQFSVLEGGVGQVALLVVGVRPVVARLVEIPEHQFYLLPQVTQRINQAATTTNISEYF